MADDLILRSGEVLTGGRVAAETWAEVKYASGTATRSLPGWKVARIVHGDPCAELERGLRALPAARFDDAQSAFEKVRAGGEGVPAWAPAYGAFYQANTLRTTALLREEGHAEAEAALEAFGREHPQALLLPAAHYALGDVKLGRKDVPGARAALALLDEKGYGVAWNLMGFLGGARATLAEGKAAEAEVQLRALIEQAGRMEGCGEVRRLAQVGRAEAIRALGKPEEAIRLLEPLLADEGWADAPVMAAVLNFVGETILALGTTPDHARTAAPFFLRVVRYFPGEHLEFARALFRTAECFRQRGSAEWTRAAERAVKTNYPGSAWAARLG